MNTIATVDELYTDFLDEVDETDSTTLKAKFKRMLNRCQRHIQPFVGVEKTWSVSIVVDTETYTSATTGMTDFYRPHEGRFLATGTTDELGNYTLWLALKEYDWSKTGFWLNQARTLYVRPKPATAGTLRVYGEKMLTDLDYAADVGAGETATPEFDEEYHDVLLWYACMEYGVQDEDTETVGSRYQVFKRKYDDIVEEMQRRYIERENDRKINR